MSRSTAARYSFLHSRSKAVTADGEGDPSSISDNSSTDETPRGGSFDHPSRAACNMTLQRLRNHPLSGDRAGDVIHDVPRRIQKINAIAPCQRIPGFVHIQRTNYLGDAGEMAQVVVQDVRVRGAETAIPCPLIRTGCFTLVFVRGNDSVAPSTIDDWHVDREWPRLPVDRDADQPGPFECLSLPLGGQGRTCSEYQYRRQA